MKSCRKYRKQIVWRAAAVLEDSQARTLSAHLETCAGCRAYVAEISVITERLAAAETDSTLHTSARFHRELTARLQTSRPESIGKILVAFLRGAQFNWRLVLPIAAALVLALSSFFTWRQPAKVASVPQVAVPAAPSSTADTDLTPTIANYQMVADQSLDKLDDLLTRQGMQNLAAVPPLSIATLLSANPSE